MIIKNQKVGTYTHCQSCGMPLDDPAVIGTEKDGSASHDYCKYCYRDGSFTNPHMTLDEMRIHLSGLMKDSKISDKQIQNILASLPQLRRWSGKNH